jgi:hypothetical protein
MRQSGMCHRVFWYMINNFWRHILALSSTPDVVCSGLGKVRCFGIYGRLVHKGCRTEVLPRIFRKFKCMNKGCRAARTDRRPPHCWKIILWSSRLWLVSLPVGYQEFRRSFLPQSSDCPALGYVKCQDSHLLDSFVLLLGCLLWGGGRYFPWVKIHLLI